MLIINKFDRLINELNMTTKQAERHLFKVIQSTNALIYTFHNEEFIKNLDNEKFIKFGLKKIWCFNPTENNVLFCSASQQWGFTLYSLAKFYHNHLGIKAKILKKYLWGRYFYCLKKRRIIKKVNLKSKKTMFVQFVLKPIWKIYSSAKTSKTSNKTIVKMLKNLGLNITIFEIENKETNRKISIIMRKFLPISSCLIHTISTVLPCPMTSQIRRINRICPRLKNKLLKYILFK